MIIVFGANGMLGKYICDFLLQKNKNIIPLTRRDFDVNELTGAKLQALFARLNLKKDDVIINCIGVIPQSKETGLNTLTTRNYFLVNALFPVLLSAFCGEAKLIHITTDCVFSGKKGDYIETDDHDETTNYGVSKSLGELSNATIIRTSIIGEDVHDYSFLEWVRTNKNGQMKGFTHHYWNGITCLQLAAIIHTIIDKNIYWKGVRHIFTGKKYSKYDMAQIINKIYHLNIDIIPFETELVDKSLSTIYAELMFDIPDLYTQILELFNYRGGKDLHHHHHSN
jgi:dTDP-4-dehydrorhamnose reductase